VRLLIIAGGAKIFCTGFKDNTEILFKIPSLLREGILRRR
jgi:hypothetical protein